MSKQRVSATPERLGRMVAVGLFAGVVAGVIVGGIGGRLMMRILTAVNHDLTGARTENGNLAGDITVDGTMSLIIFVGIFAGVFGGLVYVIVRRWMPGSGVWKGLGYGVFLFMLVGYDTIEKDNIDFELFGPPLLGIALFALLFPPLRDAAVPHGRADGPLRAIPAFPSRRDRCRLSRAGRPLRNGRCPRRGEHQRVAMTDLTTCIYPPDRPLGLAHMIGPHPHC